MAISAVVFTGGEIDSYSNMKKKLDSFNLENPIVICADSGINHANKLGYKIDLAVGDFDSYDIKNIGDYSIKEYDSKKDFTDTYIALNEAFLKNACKIYIVPGIGSRFDHSLGNLMLVAKGIEKNVNVYLLNENNYVQMTNDYLKIEKTNHNVSILPYGGEAIIEYLNGFEYEVKDFTMNITDPIGISNKIISEYGEIKIKKGTVIVSISVD